MRMRSDWRAWRVVAILITLLGAISLASAVEITFNKNFIEVNKNRATTGQTRLDLRQLRRSATPGW